MTGAATYNSPFGLLPLPAVFFAPIPIFQFLLQPLPSPPCWPPVVVRLRTPVPGPTRSAAIVRPALRNCCAALSRWGDAGEPLRCRQVRGDDGNADEQARSAVVAFRPTPTTADQATALRYGANRKSSEQARVLRRQRRVQGGWTARDKAPSNAAFTGRSRRCQNCHKDLQGSAEPMLRLNELNCPSIMR